MPSCIITTSRLHRAPCPGCDLEEAKAREI